MPSSPVEELWFAVAWLIHGGGVSVRDGDGEIAVGHVIRIAGNDSESPGLIPDLVVVDVSGDLGFANQGMWRSESEDDQPIHS